MPWPGPTHVEALAPAGARRVDVGARDHAALSEREAGGAVRSLDARDLAIAKRRCVVPGDHRQQECQPTTGTGQAAYRREHAVVFRERASQQRAPREMDRDLVRDRLERERFERLAQEDEVRQPFANRKPRRVRERVRGAIQSDREGVRSGARYMERIAPVTRAGVDHRARVRAGELGDLTDVDVEETLTDELTHHVMLIPLFLARRVHRFIRVLDQTLGSADRARDVEAAVEIPEILRGLERFLERGLREAQGRAQSLELALIDLAFRYSR